MKKITLLFVILIILFPSYGSGEPAKDPITTEETIELPTTQGTAAEAIGVNKEYLVEQRVRSLPGRHAKTVDLYISKMAAIPGAVDLGWQVHRIENGYDVVREIQKGLKVFTFKWRVADSGEITPISKKAKDITKKTEPEPKKSTN
jgi:hypothetical protein